MQKTQNNFAFIGSYNVNRGIRSLGGQVDFGRFRRYLQEKYSIKKAFLFIGYVPGNERLYEYLQSVGYMCIFKPTLNLGQGKTKGNGDAELVLYTMINYDSFDKALIVSGDGDFYCLVQHLRENKKLLTLMVPNKSYSSLYKREGIDASIKVIADLREKVQKKKRPHTD